MTGASCASTSSMIAFNISKLQILNAGTANLCSFATASNSFIVINIVTFLFSFDSFRFNL